MEYISLIKLVVFTLMLIMFVLGVLIWIGYQISTEDQEEQRKKVVACKRWNAISSNGFATSGIHCYCGQCQR